MDTLQLLQHSLIYGAILSALAGTLVLASLRVNAEMWLNDYPPDVRARFGPMTARARRQGTTVAVLFFGVLLGTIGMALAQMARASGGLQFVPTAVSLFITLMMFNVFDLVVLDWLVLYKIRPRFAILPGTDGMAGYSDFSLAVRGFWKGTVGITIASVGLAGVAVLVTALAR